MKHITASLAFLVCVFFAALPAQAQAAKRVSQDFSIRHKMQDTYDTRIQPHSGLEISGKFKVWYLLGEPVINCTARWTNPGVLQVVMDDGTRILSEPGEEEMWNLMLMAQFPNPDKSARRLQNGGGAHLSLFCDAGVVAQNGRNGFNVAGSPAWDKFICATPNKVDTRYNARINRQEKDVCASIGGDWLSSADAKKVAIAGIDIDEVMVHGVELSAGATLRRAEKMLWRQKSFAYKRTKAQDLQTRLAKKGVNKGIEAARRINTATAGVGTYPTAAMLEGLEKVVETLRAELADDSFAADWRDRDQTLVSAQLTRVAEIDRTLREREAALDRYRQQLENLAKDAPTGPVNPTEDYETDAMRLTVFRGTSHPFDYGLKDPSGRVVLAPRHETIFPSRPVNDKQFDFYHVRAYAHFFGPEVPGYQAGTLEKTHWLVNGKGEAVTPRTLRNDYRLDIFEESGGIVYALVPGSLPVIYNIPEKRMVYNGAAHKPSKSYENSNTIYEKDRTSGVRRGYVSPRTAKMYERRTRVDMIDGTPYAYTKPEPGNYAYFEPECKAVNSRGEPAPGIYPIYMYDIRAERMLTPNEFKCVATDGPQ
ncbi:hypothetical protein [Kordiimonas sp.]|uniref:hypothetical protein n=1 Tax=Kordiimonas sp. TaxID=1970157 RepID=UPI003A930339